MASDENFLSRWSRRKIAARTSPETAAGQPDPGAPASKDAAPVVAAAAPAAGEAGGERAPLPPVESLTPESDFSPFMEKEVDGQLRSKALKTLFSDPHFNVMDMLDVYVDDYSKPDPIPESWLAGMEQMKWLGDKGGRDREEAQRRALAEAAGEVPPEAKVLSAMPESEGNPEVAADPDERDAGSAQDAEPDTPVVPIPPPPIRESGT